MPSIYNTPPEAFVYVWTDNSIIDEVHQINKRYIGVHKGTPDDGYVSSGKLMLEQYEQRPHDFTREIVMYGSWESMNAVEVDLLKSVSAAANTVYYNQHNGGVRRATMEDETRSEIVKVRIKPSLKASLARLSKSDGRSLAGYIERVLTAHVSAVEVGEKGKRTK